MRIAAIGGTSSTTFTPFEIFADKHIVAGSWNGTYDISLYPGNINQFLPTNIFNNINEIIPSTQYVVLTCNSDGYTITSSTWSLTTSPPAPLQATADTPPSTFYILLGVIFNNSGIINIYQIITNNISANPSEWTRVGKAGVGPYDFAYTIYYKWSTT